MAKDIGLMSGVDYSVDIIIGPTSGSYEVFSVGSNTPPFVQGDTVIAPVNADGEEAAEDYFPRFCRLRMGY
ncbi:MAG: hypothetical protein MJK04_22285 [Psychrosphaera sp.]|nr:hypothetical protein [Psychrosphaera sp.]